MGFDFRAPRALAIDHLRYRRLWLGVGALLVGAVVVGSLGRVPTPDTGLAAQDKLLHLTAYAVLTGWFAQLFRHDLARLMIAAGFVALGVAIEFVQALVPARQFELLDMIANGSGVLLAWALSYTRVGDLLVGLESLIGRRLERV